MLLRPAQPRDALAVATVHVRAWQAGYRGLLPDAYLDSLRAEDRAPRYTFDLVAPDRPHTLVAEDGDTILGFATTLPAATLPGAGELSALHVDPSAWRRGVGRALIAAARARLLDLGFTTAIVWVLASNQRADRFYRTDAWHPDGTRRTDEVWGIHVDELRYRRPLP